ncbi:quinone-dependent dihydroorotate dehydrogenase [Leptolyngbya sp. CCY15150]|uniref:quinone-dependent dihydroorotate dehydrogenase n=1 Tax=Leptolyngbya sp. CCY15150 TaxID=2767772 RepID=UPI0019521B92
MNLYRTSLRPLLFSGIVSDPEWLHESTLKLLGWLSQAQTQPASAMAIARLIQHQLHDNYTYQHPALEQSLWGMSFANPVGLAAGFDKDGVATGIWPSLGFGFAELGTVTFHAQPGNPQPRLFRLIQDEAVLNRMGFNNQGAAALAQRLQAAWGETDCPIPLGINLGKSKITALDDAADDYRQSFRLLKDLGRYFVVNVSSPNTPGLRSLQSTEQLTGILQALSEENQQQKPILVKIAPDLDWEAIAAVVDLSLTYKLAGIIATNTTIQRDGLKTQVIAKTGNPITQEAGGISGAPLRSRSTEVIRFIAQQTQGSLPIIGVGGIFTAADAWDKITAGASLVQAYTGLVYEGPGMVRSILEGLVQRLEQQGMKHIQEAIGSGLT